MAKPSDSKPVTAPKPETKSNQPILTELSPDELAKVSGGQKVQISEINVTRVVDKSSP